MERFLFQIKVTKLKNNVEKQQMKNDTEKGVSCVFHKKEIRRELQFFQTLSKIYAIEKNVPISAFLKCENDH